MPIELIDITKSFGGKRVLDRLSLSFPDGAVSALMAPSGYGKTTLLHLLMGLIRADSGEIRGLLGYKIAPVFQENRLCDNLSAGANLRMVMRKPDIAEIERTLDALGLPGTLHTPVHELSGGMRRRVALARALVSSGDLFLFDEPFQGLDHETRDLALRYVRERVLGKTLILVTHSEDEARALGGRIIRMDKAV